MRRLHTSVSLTKSRLHRWFGPCGCAIGARVPIARLRPRRRRSRRFSSRYSRSSWLKDGDHRLWMDWLDNLIGVTGHHRESQPRSSPLPKPGNGERRLIHDAEPHLALQWRLAVPEIVLLWGELGELGQGDDTPVLGLLGEPAPLRELEVPHVRHRIGRLAAEDVPGHHVPGPLPVLLANDIVPRPRSQLNGVEPVVSRPLDKQLGRRSKQRLGFTAIAGSIAHVGKLASGCSSATHLGSLGLFHVRSVNPQVCGCPALTDRAS